MKIINTTSVSRRIHAILLSAFLALSALSLTADEKDSARAEWMTGYVKLESGDKAVASNNVVVATGLYKEALDIFENVQRKYPNWNPTLLKYRIAYCQQQIEKLEAKYQSDTSELSKEDLIALTARQAEQIQRLTTSLDELKARVSTLSESLGNMQTAAQKSGVLEATVNTLNAEKKALEDEAVRVNLRLKEALDQVAKLSAGAELQSKLSRAEEALLVAQDNINALKNTNAQQTDAIAAGKAQVTDLTKQLDDARAKLDGMTTAAKANKEILDAQAETVNKQAVQVTALEAKLALAEKTSREQAQATSSLQQEKAAMAAELAELRQFKDRVIAEREAEKQSMSASADTARKEIQALSGEVAALNTQLAEAKAQAQQLASDLAGRQQQLEGDRAKVITLEEARANLLGELERTKGRLAQAEAQNLKLVADVNALTVQQRNSADSSSTLAQQIAESNAQLDTLRKEMAAQAQQLLAQTALTTRQENVIAEMTRVITDNENSKKAQAQQLAELTNQMTAAQELAAAKQDQLTKLEAANQATAQELAASQQKLAALSQSDQQRAAERDDLLAQRQALQTRLAEVLKDAENQKLAAESQGKTQSTQLAAVNRLELEKQLLEKQLADQQRLAAEQRRALEEQLATAQQALKPLAGLSQSDTAAKRELAAVQASLNVAKADLDASTQKQQTQLALLDQHKNTIAELSAKIQTMEAQSTSKAEQEATARTRLEKELTAYQAQLAAAEAKAKLLQDAQDKLAAATEAEKKARAERDALDKKLQQEIAQRIQQEGAIAGMLQQRRNRENELAEASKTRTDTGKLEQQLRELASEKQIREQELSALRQAREQQNLQLSMAKQQVAKLEEELRTEKMKAAFPGQSAVTNGTAATSIAPATAAGSTALQDEVKALHQRLQDKDKQLLDQDKQLMAKERDLMAKNQLLQAMAGSEQEKVAWMKQLDELGKRAQQEQQQRQELEKALADKEKQRAKDLADMETKLIQVTAELTRLEQDRVKSEAELIRKETDRVTKEREQKVAINQALRQGLEAERTGNANSAKEFYGQVLAKDPQNTMALQRLGIIAATSGNDADTIKYLEQSFKQNPDDADTLLALGTAMVRQSKPDLAISMLSRAVAIDDKNASAVRAYGMALLSAGWRDAAESQLKRAVTLQPNDGDAAYNLAVLMATSQPPRLDEARQWYQKAIKAGAQPDPGMDALLKK
ncbi:MAG: hypothetical protein PHT80_01760 [Lentisphaeria bacterium]|nr:hypothetical protein [Lentisphaeria bacterium]